MEKNEWKWLKKELFKGKWIVGVEIVLIRMHMFKWYWHAILTQKKLGLHSHENWINKGAFIKSFVVEFGMLYEVCMAMPNTKSNMSSKRAFLHWRRGDLTWYYVFNEKFYIEKAKFPCPCQYDQKALCRFLEAIWHSSYQFRIPMPNRVLMRVWL